MATDPPELDTRESEAPEVAHQSHPSALETAVAWVQVAGATAVANIVVLAVAVVAGAEMTAAVGGRTWGVGGAPIVGFTAGALFLATYAWGLIAHRVPAFAHLWVPLTWGSGLVSLAMVVGASGLPTGIALTVMHLLTTAVAAHALPRRLPR